jgi:hypothetical protein
MDRRGNWHNHWRVGRAKTSRRNSAASLGLLRSRISCVEGKRSIKMPEPGVNSEIPGKLLFRGRKVKTGNFCRDSFKQEL